MMRKSPPKLRKGEPENERYSVCRKTKRRRETIDRTDSDSDQQDDEKEVERQ